MTENAITRFVYRHFSSDLKILIHEATAFAGELTPKMPAEKIPALAAEVADATAWNGGSSGPTEEEIKERAEKTAEILASHGLNGIDPEKFFAAIVLVVKFFGKK